MAPFHFNSGKVVVFFFALEELILLLFKFASLAVLDLCKTPHEFLNHCLPSDLSLEYLSVLL